VGEDRVDVRVRTAVVGLLAAGLALVLPSLSLGLDEAGLAAVLLTAALAALLGPAAAHVAVVARAHTAGTPPARPVPLVLATRPTDPAHHPLRPRAPGRG
jgi:hypothetical protein